MMLSIICTNQRCLYFNQRFKVTTEGNYICPQCRQPLSYVPPEEPTSGSGALGGMIIGGALGLIGGPVGSILGGLIGAMIGDQVEEDIEILKKIKNKNRYQL